MAYTLLVSGWIATEYWYTTGDFSWPWLLLGNGFFNVQRMGRYSKLQTSFGPPQMIMRMEINFSDGSRQVIKSGEDWKYTPEPDNVQQHRTEANLTTQGSASPAATCPDSTTADGMTPCRWRDQRAR